MFNDIFNFSILRNILISAVPALICITIHELSHGYIAYRLGDNTAKDMGRLTLNPIKHIDIMGLAMMVIVGFGWAKPVPVDMRNFKHPKWGMALTAAAGPLSNLLLALLTMFIFMLVPSSHGGSVFFPEADPQITPVFSLIVQRLALLNVFLAVFNLLPLPPLDGSKIVFSLLPERTYFKLMRYERFGMIFILILVFSGYIFSFNVFGFLIGDPAYSLFMSMIDFTYNIIT